MQKTKIPYLDSVWNVTRGCSHCGPACDHCYAARIANRFSSPPNPYAHPLTPAPAGPFYGFADANGWTGRVELLNDKLTDPLRARKPQRIGVCSTSDLFHESLPDAAIDRVFAVMALCPQHTFVLLTKRWKRMHEYMTGQPGMVRSIRWAESAMGASKRRVLWRCQPAERGFFFGFTQQPGDDVRDWPGTRGHLPNVWLGATAWDQPSLDEAAGCLLRTPAALRWVNLEPLLGPVPSLKDWLAPLGSNCRWIDWVVAGCESGPGRRPAKEEWFLNLRDQCEAARVPYYLKQIERGGSVIELPRIPAITGDFWLQIPDTHAPKP